jgi:hypothetical protein
MPKFQLTLGLIYGKGTGAYAGSYRPAAVLQASLMERLVEGAGSETMPYFPNLRFGSSERHKRPHTDRH